MRAFLRVLFVTWKGICHTLRLSLAATILQFQVLASLVLQISLQPPNLITVNQFPFGPGKPGTKMEDKKRQIMPVHWPELQAWTDMHIPTRIIQWESLNDFKNQYSAFGQYPRFPLQWWAHTSGVAPALSPGGSKGLSGWMSWDMRGNPTWKESELGGGGGKRKLGWHVML